ncbi:MAG TPA: antibiotic biosynthesis monooxygenase [Chitinophagaceae bacterium]|nr:antibiotic biosynthesis monooxygenase [Chitinophagaceae bacterium]
MDRGALLVRLRAKKGKESEVERFLCEALPAVENELSTSVWHALRADPSTYLIFDTFPAEDARDMHLSGKVAKALEERSSELFSEPPIIEKLDIVAVKMPDVVQY